VSPVATGSDGNVVPGNVVVDDDHRVVVLEFEDDLVGVVERSLGDEVVPAPESDGVTAADVWFVFLEITDHVLDHVVER
jgi:hypothetical protein